MVLASVRGATEGRTGISFPDRFKGGALEKLGVRTKGPIKVYAVGQYGDTFLLKMSYGVGASKMTAALADALKPRCSDKDAIGEFESTLVSGLPDGAPKGTMLAFSTSGGKLSVSVNDKDVGTISSKPLASAFKGIYCDGNAVCKMQSLSDAEESPASGVINPRNCAVAGGVLGYGIGKLLS